MEPSRSLRPALRARSSSSDLLLAPSPLINFSPAAFPSSPAHVRTYRHLPPLFLSSPPPPAGSSPGGLFGRSSWAAAGSLTRPFSFEMTQISPTSARLLVLLISDFLPSALSTSAAKPSGQFRGYFCSPSTISFVSPDHSRAALACRRR